MVRLQQYELLLKDLVARQHVEGPAEALLDIAEGRSQAVAQKTLGQIVGVFTDTVFHDPDEDIARFNDRVGEDEPAWIGIGFNLGLPDDHEQAVRDELTALVALRNDLVHGFVAQYDLWAEDGCNAAAEYLDAAYGTIDRHFRELRQWHTSMMESVGLLRALLAQPEIREHFWPDSLPDGAGVVREASTIADLLRQAEAELAEDGWTRLDQAIDLIRSRQSDHTPRRYGCSTWRQVLHELRPLFAVRREAGDASTPGRTWYRSQGSVPQG
ncbi:OST-HTH/LOTUS domain-containing protein [Raineyella fluvialis]|uniref:HTH OST-type domain-containing protein n=1 Tax=Raineyella fluvialis TaxID=2662261 RepID=A0A5Q2FDP4_9ACTN|nr:OST-HTH/LOTUS domain-containing protein [Raineyella fluvialis]QGF23564.1 hypothetical protein Rai3103_07690 [Raineyella fluvialis]